MDFARLTLLPAIFALSGFASPTCLNAIKLALQESSDVPAAAAMLEPAPGLGDLARASALIENEPVADRGVSNEGFPVGPRQHIKIARSPDGLFYLTARVNGTPVRFLIDTGSNSVVLANRDAVTAGIDVPDTSPRAMMTTAGGLTPIGWSKLDNVKVGNREIHNVRAAVAKTGLPVSLMGQSVLSQLGVITIDGDRLELR